MRTSKPTSIRLFDEEKKVIDEIAAAFPSLSRHAVIKATLVVGMGVFRENRQRFRELAVAATVEQARRRFEGEKKEE